MKKSKIQQDNLDILTIQKNLLNEIFQENNRRNLWKLLIFDKSSKQIINSLLKVRDLRQNNITLHLNITEKRQQLHGVTTIYIIQPTQQNIELIIHDFQMDLYTTVIIHFTSEPSSNFLAILAKGIQKRKPKAFSKIQKIQYSTLGFYSIDQKMAILPTNTEIVNFLLTFKNPAIFIYGQKQKELVMTVKEKLQNFKGKLDQSGYTLVMMFNRQMDQFPIFAHGLTYASLMSDVYNFHGLGQQVSYKSQNGQDVNHNFDLNDDIWVERKNMNISEMGLDRQLNKVKTKIMSLGNKLDQAAQLSERGKKIEWHVSAADELLKEGKRRRLNEYCEIENELYAKKMVNKETYKALIDLLTNGSDKEDKIRMMIIYIMHSDNVDEIEELEKCFPDIKKNHQYNQLKAKKLKALNSNGSESSMVGGRYIKKLAKGIWKNLMSMDKKYQIVQYITKIKELNSSDINDLGMEVSGPNLKQRLQINNIVVYCSGGVCFNEYANLMENDPNIYYTGDRIIHFRSYN